MKARALLLATATLFCGALLAAPVEQRIRGEIISVSPGAVVVRTAGGTEVSLVLDASTQYLQVLRSSLDRIEPGSYIGTATKNVGSSQVALEVGIFPPEMRGFNPGQSAWDRLPDSTLSGASAVASRMTNGTVSAVAAPSAGKVETTMTNGAVSANAARKGVNQLTVDYGGSQHTILVPSTVPIVAFRPGSASDVSKGVFVFVAASEDGGTRTAKLVAAGIAGVRPPF
jgi:hypothetical protein